MPQLSRVLPNLSNCRCPETFKDKPHKVLGHLKRFESSQCLLAWIVHTVSSNTSFHLLNSLCIYYDNTQGQHFCKCVSSYLANCCKTNDVRLRKIRKARNSLTAISTTLACTRRAEIMQQSIDALTRQTIHHSGHAACDSITKQQNTDDWPHCTH